MNITVHNYEDFVEVSSALRGVRVVFTFTSPDQTAFLYWAFIDGGRVSLFNSTQAAKPATFDDDFPDAIALTGTMSIT